MPRAEATRGSVTNCKQVYQTPHFSVNLRVDVDYGWTVIVPFIPIEKCGRQKNG